MFFLQLTLTFQSVEIILESESTLKSRGHPVLAINGRMALQLSEWSGEVCVCFVEENGVREVWGS